VELAKFNTRRKHDSRSELSFEVRAASALGISLVADGLDYVGAPIFALPIIGDIADAIVATVLYRITKNKVNIMINAVEFIPFIGDFIPTYTISTLIWILNESRRRKNSNEDHRQQTEDRGSTSPANISENRSDTIAIESNRSENLRTRVMRTIAILKSKRI